MLIKTILSLYAATLLATTSFGFDQTHAEWTQLLKQYQNQKGNVDYKKLKAESANATHAFNTYLKTLQAVPKKEFDTWSAPDQYAFLINAYNALTVKLILDNYPVKSITKIGGMFTKPWNVKFFSLLDGAIKSLDPIEHEHLRPKSKDYRIHAAVNCASISCPPLRNEAYVGSKLSAQLDEQMTQWLADPTRNTYDVQSGKLHLSKIFDWYGEDFEKWGGGVKSVVQKYGPEDAKKALSKKGEIDYLDYNWDLNEVK